MTEGSEHIIGKQLGKLLLRAKGFLEEEIFEEYTLRFKTGKKRRIDVVGIKKDVNNKKLYSIAIEVGILNGGSIEELEGYFDEAYNINKFHGNEREILELNGALNIIIQKIDFFEERLRFNFKKMGELNKHLDFLTDFYERTTGEKYNEEETCYPIGIMNRDKEEIEQIKSALFKAKGFFKEVFSSKESEDDFDSQLAREMEESQKLNDDIKNLLNGEKSKKEIEEESKEEEKISEKETL